MCLKKKKKMNESYEDIDLSSLLLILNNFVDNKEDEVKARKAFNTFSKKISRNSKTLSSSMNKSVVLGDVIEDIKRNENIG